MPTMTCPGCAGTGQAETEWGETIVCNHCNGEGNIIAPMTTTQRAGLMLFLTDTYPTGANQRRPGMSDGELALGSAVGPRRLERSASWSFAREGASYAAVQRRMTTRKRPMWLWLVFAIGLTYYTIKGLVR